MLSVIPNPPRITLPIHGSTDLFPVRRVYCVGRNYRAHAREMGADERDPPFFFLKPADTLQVVPEGATLEHPYPPRTENYHFEVELVAALARGGRDIPVETAGTHVYGYAVGLDMTRRDLQDEAKRQARPGNSARRRTCPLPSVRCGRPASSDIPGPARSRSPSTAASASGATSAR